MSLFDLSSATTRVLTSAGCVLGGAVATATCPPGAAVALAGALAGIGGNLLASDLEKSIKSRLTAGDVLRNHDLHRLTGEAIRWLILEQADRKDEPPLENQTAAVRAFANAVPKQWDAVLQSPTWRENLSGAGVSAIPGFLVGFDSEVESLTALDPETWLSVLQAMRDETKLKVNDAGLATLAATLHRRYPLAVRECLKGDQRAFAALQLMLFKTILDRLAIVPTTVEDKHRADVLAAIQKLDASSRAAHKRWLEQLDGAARERHKVLLASLDTGFVTLQASLQTLLEGQAKLQAGQSRIEQHQQAIHADVAAARDDVRSVQEDVRRLVDRPAAGVARGRPAAPHQLPPAATAGTLYGRRKQVNDLTKRLRERMNTAVLGPAGYGKTAVAAEAVEAVVGTTPQSLADSPYPDGVLFLNLYAYRGQADSIWSSMADALEGSDFQPRALSRTRATEACRDRQILVILEGGEEADGKEGRATLAELTSVLSPENRWLLLTRDKTQTMAGSTISVEEPLSDLDAGRLFDKLTVKRVQGPIRGRVLKLLHGHPLAITWAGGLLAREDENPAVLADEWEADPTRTLNDPLKSQHTLEWLFGRSVRGLDEVSRQALAAAGLLASIPFPDEAIKAAIVGWAVPTTTDVGDDGMVGTAHPTSSTKQDGRGRPSYDVRHALKQLIDRGLLRRDKERPELCGFTHDLGYQFARDVTTSDAGLRNGLAAWVHQRLSSALSAGAASTDDLLDLLRHAAARLRTDHDQQLYEPLVLFLLYDGTDRLVSLGKLDRVHLALGATRDWLDQFPQDKSEESFWQRERSASLNKLGDLATAQGNLPEAQRLFGESLRIAQRLAESDPANAEWQRDLSVSFEKLGDLATAQGNLPEAQRLFGESLRIRQRLAESDPANAAWQRDLSVSFNKLGDLATAQGNLPEAQRLFGESLRIAQRLAESDPANAEWQRDLSYSFTIIGQLLMRQGRWAEAPPLLEQSLAIDEQLAALAPTNVMFQDDVAVSRRLVEQVSSRLGSEQRQVERIQRNKISVME